MHSFLDVFSSLLQVTRTIIKAWTSSNFGKIPLPTTKLAALEHLKNKLIYNIETTLVPLFLIGSSSFSQVRSTTKKSWMGSKFSQMRPLTAELGALEYLEIPIDL